MEFEGRLAAWMDAEGLGSGPIVGAQRLGGGTQNIIVLFHREGRGYVLRRPPETARPEASETIRREARFDGIPADAERLAVRMIHGTGQVDLVDDLLVHPRLVAAGRLSEVEHAVQLGADEAVALLRGQPGPAADEVAERQRWWDTHTIDDAPPFLRAAPAPPPPTRC